MNGTEELLEDDLLEDTCLGEERCIEELIRDAPEGCLYCVLAAYDAGEDE